MNVSTGAPHILLFERDQQLAALLTSELQMAGYESHTARTAVEVFDAIARYPIRLVLVNLAQAAAARREFWVALDTQRRGSNVQVLTFHCSNLAGYGARDPDENTSTPADMDVDGMMGLMTLVDAVRARVPNMDTIATTLPRMPRVTPFGQASIQRTGQQPAIGVNGLRNGTAQRRPMSADAAAHTTMSRSGSPVVPQTPPTSPQVPTPPLTPPTAPSYGISGGLPINNGTSNMAGSAQPGQEKIRAVLYPNQRTWSSQNAGSFAPALENQGVQNVQPPYPAQANQMTASAQSDPSSDSTMLQRLANGNGQGSANGQKESGLAQLTRLVEAFQSPVHEESGSIPVPITPSYRPNSNGTSYMPDAANASVVAPDTPLVSGNAYIATTATGGYHPATNERTNTSSFNTAQSQIRPTSTSEAISAQPLRPAPIQDLPGDRLNSGPLPTDGGRRPDVLSRAGYTQPTQSTAVQAPLASIVASVPPKTLSTATPLSPPSTTDAGLTSATLPVGAAVREQRQSELLEPLMQNAPQQQDSREATNALPQQASEQAPTPVAEQTQEQLQQEELPIEAEEEKILSHNAVILDILQSFPVIPKQTQTIRPQAVQPQVLHGRATRSLGHVLLDGHLVPQDRLEVAQNIQRMLRGVDLNYQLGDILLMFKLLTPDQLLAAALVSYGLITTTQITALGRIRQELHAIGLEYDLENLLILFRILTPEQLREVRSSFLS